MFIVNAASISGLVEIGDGTFVGTNATIIPRLKIGKWVSIGAGSIIIKNVPDYAILVGNPAKVIKYSKPVYQNEAIYDDKDSPKATF